MKFTKDWLDVHLKTNKSEAQIIQKLNSIGLEVEKVEPLKNELSDFVIAKIIIFIAIGFIGFRNRSLNLR